MAPLLEVNNLSIEYKMEGEPNVEAVRDVSFTIERGENLGLVGESGCGKTTTATSVIRNLSPNGKITSGEIIFDGKDITHLSKKELQKLRWKEISMISQSAMASLNPVYTINEQIREAIQAHESGVSNKQARIRGEELFELVGMDPDRITDYPHQLSGGMRQRAIIAMALVHNPKLIIADEPTTALDVIVQEQILHRINELQNEINSSMLMITHDISVVAATCDKVAVMYGGELMEVGTTEQIYNNSHHPYTLGLQNAFPSIEGEKQDLVSIPGFPPDLSNPPTGCPFAVRCPWSAAACEQPLPEVEVEDGHRVMCHEPTSFERIQESAGEKERWQAQREEVID
jgi:oligopeptide/dipeptide ABC transporter ATP-binding protein